MGGKGGGGGGADHVSMAKWARFCICNRQEMPGSSEQDRPLQGLCIPRSLLRWHELDPLGGLLPAYVPEIRKGRRGGARASHVSGAVGRSREITCVATTALVDHSKTVPSAHQLVQLLCHHCTVSSRLRCTKRAGAYGRPRARTGHKTVVKHLRTFFRREFAFLRG
jgi:hypothetical protein